jgi:hypothetical protein
MSTQREFFTAMPESRLEFICRLHGSADGSRDSVQEDQRENLEAHIEFQDQARLKLFEKLCGHFGSPTGFFEDVPESNRAAALLNLEELAAHFANSCDYELRIFCTEAAEAEAAD